MPASQRFYTGQIADYLSSYTGLHIEARKIDIPLSGDRITVYDISLNGADNKPWYAVAKAEVLFDTRKLLQGELIIPEVKLSGVYGGVHLVKDYALPVEPLIAKIKEIVARTKSQSDTEDTDDSGLRVRVDAVTWDSGSGYFTMDDPGMFVVVPGFAGEITFPDHRIMIHTRTEPVEYVLFDWAFRSSGISATVEIDGDMVRITGQVDFDEPKARLYPDILINSDNGDVELSVHGTADTSLVNDYYTPFPKLDGQAHVDVHLSDKEEFELSAVINTSELQIEHRFKAEDVSAKIHMNEERLWLDKVLFSGVGGGQYDVTGVVNFWPVVTVQTWIDTQAASISRLLRIVAANPLPVTIEGGWTGRVFAKVDLADDSTVKIDGTIEGTIHDHKTRYDVMTFSDEKVALKSDISLILPDLGQTEFWVRLHEWRGDESLISGVLHSDKGRMDVDISGVLGGRYLKTISADQVSAGKMQFSLVGNLLKDWLLDFSGHQIAGQWFADLLSADGRIISNGDDLVLDGIRLISGGGGFLSVEGTARLDPPLLSALMSTRDLDLSKVKVPGYRFRGLVNGNASISYDHDRTQLFPGDTELSITKFVAQDKVFGDVAFRYRDRSLLTLQVNGSTVFNGFLKSEIGNYAANLAVDLPLDLLQPWLGDLKGHALGRIQVKQEGDRPVLEIDGAVSNFVYGTLSAKNMDAAIRIDDARSLFGEGPISGQMSAVGVDGKNLVAFAYSWGSDETDTLWHYAYIDSLKNLLALPSEINDAGFELSGMYYLQDGKPVQGTGMLSRANARMVGDLNFSVTAPVQLTMDDGLLKSSEMLLGLKVQDKEQWQRGSIRYLWDGPLSFFVDIDASLPLVDALIPEFTFFGGSIKGSMAGIIDPDGLMWQGTLDFKGGEVALAALGLRKRLRSGRIVAEGVRWQLSDFVFEDPSGRIQLNGDLILDADAIETSLNVDIQHQVIRIGAGVQASASGDLRIQLGADGPLRVEGELDLHDALLSDRIDWELALLKFQKRSAARLEEIIEDDIRFNLLIRNNARIRIDNNLADALIDGDFTIRGSPRKIGLTGNLQVVAGTLFWQGVNYKIESALVQFVDPLVFNPVIDLEAVAVIPYYDPDAFGPLARTEYKITLNAYGPLNSLQLNLSSEPYLEQVDILSMLMFGVLSSRLRGGNEDSASQIQLINIGLGTQIARFEAEIEDLTGFDKFELRPTFSRGADTSTVELSLEKRLSDRLKIRLESSVDQIGEQRFGLDYTVSNYVKLSLGWDNQTDVQIGNFSLQPAFRFPLP